MPTFGLVLSLAKNESARRKVLACLSEDPRVRLGSLTGHRLPLVLTTARSRDEAGFIEKYLRSGTVLGIDVAYANFEDLVEDARGEETLDETPA